jgi:hypothetical protein
MRMVTVVTESSSQIVRTETCTHFCVTPYAMETALSRFDVHYLFGGSHVEVRCCTVQPVVWEG